MSCSKCNQDKCCCVNPFRYKGPDLDCLGIVTDQTYDAIVESFASEICDLNEAIDNVQGIDHTSFTSSTGIPSNLPGQPGQVDTYTVWGDAGETIVIGTFNITNGTAGTNGTDGTDGTDAATEYANTLFVDRIYGDDTTGTREDFSLPYLTYAGALVDAVPGDTIVLRSGVYNEDVTLQDDVNVRCDGNVNIIGSIKDDGVKVTSTVSGNANITYTGFNAIDITGVDSDVDITVDTIVCTRTAILVRPGVGNAANAVVNCRKIVGPTVNYFITCNGAATVVVNVKESMETAPFLTLPFSGINIQDFVGDLIIKCPKVVLGDSSNINNGVLFEEFSTSGASRVYVEIDQVLNNFSLVSPNEQNGTISKKGASIAVFNIKRMKCLTRTGITVLNDTGLTIFEGHISVGDAQAVRHSSTGKLVIKNSTLQRTDGANGNEVVAAGDFGVNVNALGTTDGVKLEIINSRIVRSSAVAETVGNGAILTTQGATSKVLLKDCDIVALPIIVGPTAPVALDGPIGQGRFYINNVKTNLVAGGGPGLVQLEANAGELVVGDTELITYDILG